MVVRGPTTHALVLPSGLGGKSGRDRTCVRCNVQVSQRTGLTKDTRSVTRPETLSDRGSVVSSVVCLLYRPSLNHPLPLSRLPSLRLPILSGRLLRTIRLQTPVRDTPSPMSHTFPGLYPCQHKPVVFPPVTPATPSSFPFSPVSTITSPSAHRLARLETSGPTP